MPASDLLRRFFANLSGKNIRSAEKLMGRSPPPLPGMAGPQIPRGADMAKLRGDRANAWANLLGGTTIAGAGGYAANEALHPMDAVGGLLNTNVGHMVDQAGHAVGRAAKLPGRFMGAIKDELGLNVPPIVQPSTPTPSIMDKIRSLTPTQIGLGMAGAGAAGLAGYGAYKALSSGDEDQEDGDYSDLRKTAHVITTAYIEEFARVCRDAGMDKQAASALLRSAVEARSPDWAVKAAAQRAIGLDPAWAGIVTFKLATAK